ncbi:hypothetical protein, conserved [Eimeria brunetti]|uniref:Uncharacterized protein n=1 Tax=Eimeria brunetti TaxID=51314 RepID=U6LR73_9EIME|nr:hypothetical protein, conserved [Eimeria brunetti]
MADSLFSQHCLRTLESARQWVSSVNWTKEESELRKLLASIHQKITKLQMWRRQKRIGLVAPASEARASKRRRLDQRPPLYTCMQQQQQQQQQQQRQQQQLQRQLLQQQQQQLEEIHEMQQDRGPAAADFEHLPFTCFDELAEVELSSAAAPTSAR